MSRRRFVATVVPDDMVFMYVRILYRVPVVKKHRLGGP
jgi:hypothetical protein